MPSSDQSAAAPSADQSATSSTGAAPADNSAASAQSSDQNAASSDTTAKNEGGNGKLPQTASPLPLLGLMGFGSMITGYFSRKRK
jgi:LPXTG-motif cell wall-anchored protein